MTAATYMIPIRASARMTQRIIFKTFFLSVFLTATSPDTAAAAASALFSLRFFRVLEESLPESPDFDFLFLVLDL